MGYGISLDVENLSFAVLDRDQTGLSRSYILNLSGSRYFREHTPIRDDADLDRRMRDGEISLAIEIPPGFARHLQRGDAVQIGAWVDGAMPQRADTIKGYVQGIHQTWLIEEATQRLGQAPTSRIDIETRFRYNQDFDSIYAMVPGAIALQLALIPAILMALAIVREKELGSITNLYVTPVTRLEFLLGKQLPYVILAFVNFLVMFLMAIFIFQVPLKGGFGILALGALVYVMATTSFGMVVSAFTSTQIAALFGTVILTILPATMFSGMSTPASSITGFGRVLGALFPMTYFLPISVGAFTKGLHFADLTRDLALLSLFAPALILISLLLLRKQER
jgi:ribosome-dependent ATPase